MTLAALPGSSQSEQTERIRQLAAIVLTGLAIRLVVMAFMYTKQLDPALDHWRFGYETGRIARAIVSGRGFSSPLYEDTGPTAWMTPGYPYIVAGFFKVFGIYTTAAAVALLSFNALISALTSIPVFFAARGVFGVRTAKHAAWTWAWFPYAVYFPVERIWETWLATLLFSLVLLMVLNLEKTRRLLTWVGTGAVWGACGLTSSALLVVAPFLHVWVAYRRHRRREDWLVPSVICALVALAVVAPWFIRNYRVFHRFIPFRDNIGLVLRLGTQGDTDYWGPYELGPWHNDAEWAEFKHDGELAYMATKQQQAVEFIKANPGWYLRTALRRMVFIWTGFWSLDKGYLKREPWDPVNIVVCLPLTVLALMGLRKAFKQRSTAAVPYAIVWGVFPLLYYFTSPEFYYRRPMDPMIVTLAVYAIVRETDPIPSAPANDALYPVVR